MTTSRTQGAVSPAPCATTPNYLRPAADIVWALEDQLRERGTFHRSLCSNSRVVCDDCGRVFGRDDAVRGARHAAVMSHLVEVRQSSVRVVGPAEAVDRAIAAVWQHHASKAVS
jgi:hypothetical protein